MAQNKEINLAKSKEYYNKGKQIRTIRPDSAIYYLTNGIEFLIDIRQNNSSEKYFSEEEKLYRQILNELADLYSIQNNYELSIKYYSELLDLHKSSSDKKGMSVDYHGLAYCFSHIGKVNESLEYYKRSVAIKEELGLFGEAGTSMINIGYNLNQIGDVKGAIEAYEKALFYYQKEKNNNVQSSTGIAQVYNNLATLYNSNGDTLKPLEMHRASLAIKEKNNDKKGISISLINIGVYYYDRKEYANSIEYYERAINILTEINDQKNLAAAHSNLAESYLKTGNTEKSLQSESTAIEIRKKTNDKHGLCSSYNNLSNRLIKNGKYDEALTISNEHLNIAQELKIPQQIKNASDKLKNIYLEKGDYAKALEYYELNILMKDSITSEQNKTAALKSIAKYEYEKKESTLKAEFEKQKAISDAILLNQSILIEQNQRNTQLLEKENEIQKLAYNESQQQIIQKQLESENQEKQIQILNTEKKLKEADSKEKAELLKQQKRLSTFIIFVISFCIILLFAAIMAFLKNKKSNKIIREQKRQTEIQKKIVEEKQKEILDSIRYAKRIQNSLLPLENTITKSLNKLKI
jgi:tetratricopeptide (TPR) repeat protein